MRLGEGAKMQASINVTPLSVMRIAAFTANYARAFTIWAKLPQPRPHRAQLTLKITVKREVELSTTRSGQIVLNRVAVRAHRVLGVIVF